jgi:hypothetical protein
MDMCADGNPQLIFLYVQWLVGYLYYQTRLIPTAVRQEWFHSRSAWDWNFLFTRLRSLPLLKSTSLWAFRIPYLIERQSRGIY